MSQTAKDFQMLIDQLSKTNSTTAETMAHQFSMNNLLPRSMDWILSAGKCLDNLTLQKSTVSDAGRGAFAQRFIPKGESIVMAPLLHIMDYKSTFMYELKYDEDDEVFRDSEDNEHVGSQLINNYCFSHDESTMLLCPQTNAAAINHCSERGIFDGDCLRYNQNEDAEMRGANAEIKWADDWDSETEEWLKMSLGEIKNEVWKGRRGLSLEFVATRDIYPGDEVRISFFDMSDCLPYLY